MISCQITYTLHLCLVIMSDYIHFTSFSGSESLSQSEFDLEHSLSRCARAAAAAVPLRARPH